MKDDFLDDFLAYDLTFGADEVKCPHCGELVSCSMLIDDGEIECSKWGNKFRK